MAFITTAITAALTAANGIVTHLRTKRENVKREKLNTDMQNANRADLVGSSYRNSLDSPTAKGQMENIRRQAERSNNMRDNENVAGGMTHEAMLASKNATNNQVANAQNNVVANQEASQARKDERYMGRKMGLNAQEQAIHAERENNSAVLGDNITNALGSAALAFDKEPTDRNVEGDNQELISDKWNVSNMVDNKLKTDQRTIEPSTVPNLASLNNDKGITSVVNRANANNNLANMANPNIEASDWAANYNWANYMGDPAFRKKREAWNKTRGYSKDYTIN